MGLDNDGKDRFGNGLLVSVVGKLPEYVVFVSADWLFVARLRRIGLEVLSNGSFRRCHALGGRHEVAIRS
jgi:hypothetical protein